MLVSLLFDTDRVHRLGDDSLWTKGSINHARLPFARHPSDTTANSLRFGTLELRIAVEYLEMTAYG
jgi:hypothetical protein